MNIIKTLSLASLSILALSILALSVLPVGHATAGDSMPPAEGAMMKKEETMMMKADHQSAFTTESFMAAQASGKPFLVAFHKKGCPMCAEQQQALNSVYADPKNADLKVLAVDYDNDTPSLKKFNVGMQGTLILYKGDKEISRTNALTKATDIQSQLSM